MIEERKEKLLLNPLLLTPKNPELSSWWKQMNFRDESYNISFYIQEVCCESKQNFTQERSGRAALPGRVLAEIPGTGSYPGGVTD